jgi:hypothetical protein
VLQEDTRLTLILPQSTPILRGAGSAPRRSIVQRFLLALAICLISGPVLAVTFVPLYGDVSVTTSSNRRSAAVTVSNNGAVTAQFCLSLLQPLDQPINLSEKGQVIYLPQEIEGLPPGAQISGPEPIAQTLTVLTENGSALAFVAKGVKPIAQNAKVILITNVSRQDWTASNEAHRVPGVEACLSASS